MPGKIDSEQLHAAGSRCQQARQHFDGCGFSGAVWPEKAKELSRGHAQIDAIHGSEFAKFTSKLLGQDRSIGHEGSRKGCARETLARLPIGQAKRPACIYAGERRETSRRFWR